MTIWTPDLTPFEGPLPQTGQGHRAGHRHRHPLTRDPAADPQGSGRQAGVTVGTVTRAYTEAERRGLLAARVGHGTWVRGAADPANEWVIRNEDSQRIELWQNLPVQLDRGAIIRPLLTDLAQGISTACSVMTRRRDAPHSASCSSTGSPSRASRRAKIACCSAMGPSTASCWPCWPPAAWERPCFARA